MSVYLGNITIGNGNYLGNENIVDAGIFVPVPPPTTTTTTVFPPQYWNVRKCGTSDPTTQLGIQINLTLTAGQAIRPVIAPGSTIALPGYENACYELISTTTTGTLCGTRAPAASCAQSVCTVLPTTTTTTTAAP
jgi:hypothetical protein